MSIKIIQNGDADLEAALAACEAALLAGADGVSIERTIPVVMEMPAFTGASDCSSTCTVGCRECELTRLQTQYTEEEAQLHRTGDKLRRVAAHE